ncbi:cellulose binding domain-containing protein [Shewanella violacea]|uniref:PKD domain-containing protein n=1 Tax=Shewanella violacea (strain JCM 10179 / CIP 106290 / LMG 19151 / DSS12) TaxID=637905 RepID=D4ZGP6_SHEVD|nr:cellulose binding domain-containing protein [Shewanella violacea]BAJ00845.1 hypothetical protein SVI_0874 [Shewanella violacea DSS12]
MKTRITRIAAIILLSGSMSQAQADYDGSNGPGVPDIGWTQGQYLSHIPYGGRMVTFHRGYYYIMGQGSTSLWDISAPETPVMVDEHSYGDNGHRWYKLNTDLFWREYTVPELQGSPYHFLDMSDMLNLVPWSDENVPVPILKSGQLEKWQTLETFPTGTNGGNVHDLRFDDPNLDAGAITSTFSLDNAGVNSSLRFRIGNLMFVTGNGLSVFDIGDPLNIKLLDSIVGSFNQYTTTYHVWRNYVVYLNGNNANEESNNMVMIDFSDPSDLKYAGGVPFAKSPGRYMYFQDKYGFAGSDDYGVKLNMETLEVEQVFDAPGQWPDTFLDFQWMPLGPILSISGSNGGKGKTFFYAHQDGPDIKGPEIGFHHPFANSTNMPVTSVIGFVINEILEERSLNSDTIVLRKVGSGHVIKGDVVSTSYQTVNFVPKQRLEENSTYKVTLVANGIKDIAGNGVDEYSFLFSTGSLIDDDPAPVIQQIDYGSKDPIIIEQAVTFTATAIDEDNDPLQYRWDFGEGNNQWSGSNSITHTFTQAGLHSVSLQVRDSGENIVTRVQQLVVIESAYGDLPRQSAQMALNSDRQLLAVVNPDNNSLSIIDTNTGTKLAEIPVCQDPVSVTQVNDEFWLACRDANQITILSALTHSVTDTIKLEYGALPIALVSDLEQEHVYAALMGSGNVIKIASRDRQILASNPVGTSPRALALSGDGASLLVTQFISDAEKGEVWQLNSGDLSISNVIELPLDTSSMDTSSSGRGVPNYLASIAIHPSDRSATVVGKKDNIVRGLSRDGMPLTFETSSRSLVAKLDLLSSTEAQHKRVDIDDHALPVAGVYDQYGSYLFLAMQGNNRIIVLNANSGQEITRLDVGLAPQSLLLDHQSKRLYVKNFMDRSVSIVDVSQLLDQVNTKISLLDTIDTVSSETLTAQVLKGKQIFYNAADKRMGSDGYMACANCHMDGEQDGQVWDFTDRGEGLRNTISLKGRAGTAHGRVHWSANFDEIHDFEHDMRGPFSGSGFIPDSLFNQGLVNQALGDKKAGISTDLDALSAYVSSLNRFNPSPYRNADGELTPQAVLGEIVFNQANCASCHSGEAFTDSPLGFSHDVGTLTALSGQRLSGKLAGIDTPTLRDIFSTAPYLHDGSALSLASLFGKDNAHGNTAGLTPEKLEQLVAYLKQVDGTNGPAPVSELSLSLAGLSEGSVIEASEIPLELETNLTGVTRVEYYADGLLVAISQDTPFNSSWTPVELGRHRLQAKAFYNQGLTASLTPEINIEFGANGGCHITYTPTQEWSTGFQVDLLIANTGEAEINGYLLTFTLGDGEALTNGWNGTFTSSENIIEVTNDASLWNGNIPVGGNIGIGFQGNKSNSPLTLPDHFKLNGKKCTSQ